MTSNDIIKQLKSHANPKNVVGMARFGIQGKEILGISMPILRKLAKDIKGGLSFAKATDNNATVDIHKVALELWETGIHEAKILASMIDDPKSVTSKQMDSWIKDFDSWDVCDQVCMNLFCYTDLAPQKIGEWVKHEPEFERRAGFALLAVWAWKRKDLSDKLIAKFLPLAIEYATDDRNYVRKAVNWALRQIGKRSVYLEQEATKTAKEILKLNNKTGNWIAKDTLREFERRKNGKRI